MSEAPDFNPVDVPAELQGDPLMVESIRETNKLMAALMVESKSAKDATTVYAFTGKNFRFFRSGIREAITAALYAVNGVTALSKRTKARLAALEAEVAELRASRTRFCGVHQRALSYKRGDLVTHAGSLWSCVEPETSAVPGHSNDWQLAVKRGSI